MFFVVIAAVTILTLCLPWLVPQAAKRLHITVHRAPVWLAILAAAAYCIAPFLPDIHISHETNSFQEHFFGGGLYTTLLFIYFTKLLGWRPNWLLVFMALFAWTSALGTINELLEFGLVKLNITEINITDTSWDLVANTTGMLVGFIVWRLAEIFAQQPDN